MEMLLGLVSFLLGHFVSLEFYRDFCICRFYVECSNFLQKKELLCSSLYHNPSPSKVPIRPDYGPTPVRRVINHDAEPNTSNMSVAHIGKSNPGIDENRHRFFFPGIN